MEEEYKVGDEVEVTVKRFSKLGAFVAIKGGGYGLIYQNDIYIDLEVGDTTKAYIKTIREDGKIDLVLRNPGYRNYINPVSDKIIEKLNAANGFLPFNDKTPPGKIKAEFQMSKTQFKQAIGKLYRDKIITITDVGIYLV